MDFKRSCATVALVLVGGCASYGPPPMVATEAELIERRGMPTRVWTEPDGSRTLEYSSQPTGYSNWMVSVDAEGRVVGRSDALTRENLREVREGMSVEQVQRLLGQHRRITRYRLSGEEVWDWNVENEWLGLIATYFNVHFVDGAVRRTSFTFEYPNDNDGDRH